MSDEHFVGASNNYWYRSPSDEEILGSLPDPPAFREDIELVRDQVRKVFGKVGVGRIMTVHHPVIARLLAEDMRITRGPQKTRACRKLVKLATAPTYPKPNRRRSAAP
jgi:hypothetical protein